MYIKHPYRDYFAAKSLTGGYDRHNYSNDSSGFSLAQNDSYGHSYAYLFFITLAIFIFKDSFTNLNTFLFIGMWIAFYIVHHLYLLYKSGAFKKNNIPDNPITRETPNYRKNCYIKVMKNPKAYTTEHLNNLPPLIKREQSHILNCAAYYSKFEMNK